MSRSYKHSPFQAICGGSSAKKDKQVAHRTERRTISRQLNIASKSGGLEDFVAPHRRECSHNNVYDWCRDGNQRFCGLSARDWNRHLDACTNTESLWFGDEHYIVWPPSWYSDMMRK